MILFAATNAIACVATNGVATSYGKDVFLTTSQAGKQLNLSRASIRYHIHEGHLAAFSTGERWSGRGLIRIYKMAVDNFSTNNPPDFDLNAILPSILTIKDVASLWQCSEETIRRLVRKGRILSYRDNDNGHILILRKNLVTFILKSSFHSHAGMRA